MINSKLSDDGWFNAGSIYYRKKNGFVIIDFTHICDSYSLNTWNTIVVFDNKYYLPIRDMYDTISCGEYANEICTVRITKDGKIQIYQTKNHRYYWGKLIYIAN